SLMKPRRSFPTPSSGFASKLAQADSLTSGGQRLVSTLFALVRVKLKLVLPVNIFRIALANIRFPATPDESITSAEQAIAQASIDGAGIICFPECYVPGYRGLGKSVPPPDPAFLERAWSAIA